MYRIEDIEKIDKNINKIKNAAAKEYKNHYEPTLTEMSQVYNAIKKYIIKNKKIVYGGFAQNLLITKKNPLDYFYTEINGAYFNWPDIADIEFYSPTPIKDMIEITEELHSLGFKHIEGVEGVHPETFKIFVNLINYCDISYMSENIYNNMSTIIIDNIICAEPNFMLIDAFRVLTDPLTSYWRLDKSINRFQKILKYYPLDQSLNDKKIYFKSNLLILKFIRKKIIHNSKLIVVGFLAFNYYAKKVSTEYVINNYPYYELISDNYIKDSSHIHTLLKHKFGDKITIKHFAPFFLFMDKRTEYYYENNLILKLYGNNSRCTVYNFSDKKHTNYGTYNLVFMYLLFNYYYAVINNNKDNVELYQTLLGKLFYLRNKYLNSHSITVVDKSPFQDFTLKCYGIPVDSMRENKLQKRTLLKYIPQLTKLNKIDYAFVNSSGNEIK
jgi:hypothetical protein